MSKWHESLAQLVGPTVAKTLVRLAVVALTGAVLALAVAVPEFGASLATKLCVS